MYELLVASYDFETTGDHEVSIFDCPFPRRKSVVSKRPNELVHAARLSGLTGNIKIIFMIRDIRDIVCSRHGRNEELFYVDASVSVRNMKRFDKYNNNKNIILIKYEDLVSDPESVQCRIEKFLGQPDRRANFTDFGQIATVSRRAERAMGGVRQLSSDSMSSWQRSLPRVKEQIRKFPKIQAFLEYFDYERDDRWTKLLQNVDDVEYVSERIVRARKESAVIGKSKSSLKYIIYLARFLFFKIRNI